MKMRILSTTLAAIALTALGILAGRYSTSSSSGHLETPARESNETVVDPHAGDLNDDPDLAHDQDDDPDHMHDQDEESDAATEKHDHPHFSAEALLNMGVTTAPLTAQTYVQRHELLGSVAATALNSRPLTALSGGQIVEVLAEPGMMTAPGEVLIRYLRDPIPRPELTLTGEILTPAREAVHESVAELRRNREEVAIFEAELKRISAFTEGASGDLPIIPRQTAIDLKYQLLRAQRALEQAQLELAKHGFSAEQIVKMSEGATIPDLGQETWRRALEHNGLWTESAAGLFETLPDELKADRWAVATVAEIAAGGLASAELIAYLDQNEKVSRYFLEIGALLQKGMSVREIALLGSQGALESLVTVRTPANGDLQDWDVSQVLVQTGARISRGERLLTLSDHRRLRLRIDPVGSEQATALAALGHEGVCRARPLITGAGPEIESLTLEQATGDDGGQGMTIWTRLENSVVGEIREAEGRRFRSWSLRPGLRYLVGVPRRTIEDAFVVPLDALTKIGPDTVIFMVDGDSFLAVPVVVGHRDERFAVIPSDDSALFVGDEIVVAGAYALGLAMTAGQPQADPHAGHAH